MDTKELAEIISRHKEWLETGLGSPADLSRVNLSGADLSGADLSRVNLRGADLSRADLRGAYLSRADLSEADLPSPTMVLLASWGQVSDDLCADLMNYDAACHPDPSAFERWVATARCPYEDVKFARSANFGECRGLWEPARPLCRPWDLMVRVIREKCMDSDFHDTHVDS